MGRLFGYVASRPDGLRDALLREREAIAPPPSINPAGWGIGFYQGGEVLHKKRPTFSKEEIDWEEVAGDVRSDCVIVHLRDATVGERRSENTHPFRMRRWLFAHNGTIDRFDRIQPKLLESMPDFLRRNVRGDTDSELFFHVVLSFLHEGGQLDKQDVEADPVLAAIRSSIELIDRLSSEADAQQATLNMILTNGRQMFALARGTPLMYVERQGVQDGRTRDEPIGAKASSALRYVLAVGDGNEVPEGYERVPEGSVLTIDRELNADVYAL